MDRSPRGLTSNTPALQHSISTTFSVLLEDRQFLLRQHAKALLLQDIAGLGHVGDFKDHDGAVVGDETGGVVEVDVVAGQAIGHGMQSAGLVRDFNGERVHQFGDEAFVFEGLEAISGSLTRNFITPNRPVLATASQRMLMLALARILVKWATCPGLFSAKAATNLTSLI